MSGIFNEWDINNNYAEISEKDASGTIKGEVRVKNKSVSSTAHFTNNTKDHTGLEITLVNNRGEETIFIPQGKIPPISELAKMKGSPVYYKSRTWSSDMEGTSVTSKITILNGKLVGRVYEGQEFA